MQVNKLFIAIFVFLLAGLLHAQQEVEPVAGLEAPVPEPPRPTMRLQDFKLIVARTLQDEFPRLPLMFTGVHSCRLPDYGPVITVTLQPPPYYFMRPVLEELEEQRKFAERRAKEFRSQIERAAELIKLRSREAEILETIEETSSKRKGKQVVAALEKELASVRDRLRNLEEELISPALIPVLDPVSEVDLDKMVSTKYQQLLQKLTAAMRNVLAENAASLEDINQNEKISITTHVRQSSFGNQGRSIVFVLNGSDIQAFRIGDLDLNELKEKVLIHYEKEE